LQVFEGAVVRTELVHLVLGEVADAQPLGLALVAAGEGQLAGQDLDEGGFAGAVGAEETDAVARLQAQPHLVQNDLVSITGAALVQGQEGARQAGRGAEGEVERAIDMGRGDALHALQGLDAALGLAGLGGLGAEALDEALDAADFLLLADEGGLALAQAFGAQGLEGAVVAGVKIQMALLDMGNLADDGVQEVAVVGNQQEGTGIVAQPGFQPDDRVQVQVVGGLVEEHEVGAAHEGARQAQAHAPASGPARHRASLLAGVEAQAVEQAGGAALGGVAADGLQAGMEFALAQAVPRRLRCDQVALHLA
jgi:hypothetical protein